MALNIKKTRGVMSYQVKVLLQSWDKTERKHCSTLVCYRKNIFLKRSWRKCLTFADHSNKESVNQSQWTWSSTPQPFHSHPGFLTHIPDVSCWWGLLIKQTAILQRPCFLSSCKMNTSFFWNSVSEISTSFLKFQHLLNAIILTSFHFLP